MADFKPILRTGNFNIPIQDGQFIIDIREDGDGITVDFAGIRFKLLPVGMKKGGGKDEILSKISGDDFDTEWRSFLSFIQDKEVSDTLDEIIGRTLTFGDLLNELNGELIT